MSREQTFFVVVALVVVYAIGVWHFATHERAVHMAKEAKRDADIKAQRDRRRKQWEANGRDDFDLYNPPPWYVGPIGGPNYGMAAFWPVSYPLRAAYRAIAARSDARSRALSEQYLRELYADEVTAHPAPSGGGR